ncbi:MAG TPA: alkaline phosphatase D family protein [Solirubrobacteraceae bacterium]|nr:alkaline phosphatase D family protein [Solirubrobacteraceae bacterium]
MTKRIDRRTFVRGAAVGAGALILGPASSLLPRAARAATLDGVFRQGVASGEPGPRAITLWTRLDELDHPAVVDLEVATDATFANVVHRAQVPVEPDRDFTARARLQDGFLAPGEEYHYRFATAGADSPVGRFRTARPAGSRERVRIAFFSCQEFIAGFYTAHADLARQDVDLVVCLGDYIYEQAFADQTSRNAPVRADDAAADGEAQTLAEYRRKYSLYHTDERLLEVRRQFPLLAIWDDHEVEDNYAGETQGGAAGNRRVPFAERRANGYRAWYEHMPRVGTGDIYGAVPLGAADVFLLDTRQYRDDQPCNPSDAFLSNPCPPSETDAPGRTLLGATQKAWLKDALAASQARWKLIANQVMITSLDAPPHNPLNTDSWDGYGAERAELIDHIASRGIEDVAFITGDIHTYFAGNVTRTGRHTPIDGPVRATEFVCGSITSPGIVDRVADSEPERVAAAALIDAAVLGNNPQIVYSNQAYKGYGLVEATAGELRVTYRAVRETRRQPSEAFTLRSFRVAAGEPAVIDEGGPLPLPAPAAPGPLPDRLTPQALSAGAA